MNFKDQAEQFLKTAQTRKRNPIKASTVRKYESSLSQVMPILGNMDLADINNGTLKTLVTQLSSRSIHVFGRMQGNCATKGLSASTIVGMVTVVKLVVASAVNDQGEELYPRVWNHEFIDLPVIDPNSQKAPVAGGKAVYEAVEHAEGEEKALYALLAGSGLRIEEAHVLMVGPEAKNTSTWDPQTGTIYIRPSAEWTPKTDAGVRDIDLAPELNDYLIAILKPVEGQPMFTPVSHMTGYRHLEKAGIPGFHSLRRFRVTHLRKSVPEGLLKFWIGHANESVTDRYDKIRIDVEARRQYAAKAGLGFSLPQVK